ncbi:ABC transporter ATP-binding protein [Synechococcus elongatus]|uniref:ATP-binding cassette domain-containing protein n=1 Tax=Synechococcus elongatus PCC 11802 TaxID=2283154 RepID=A0AAU6R5L8_SYNEL|nr:ATP-binding cassette domain-containing protein [Synechococcus elongatus]QFZ92981.1 ATP-binding cassette domain-containing protein [Synechococcus elongatus PCC 11802]
MSAATVDSASGRSPLLVVENLGRRLQQDWIWQNIQLRLDAGDRLAIMGPSGVGKSLLLRAIAGLDPIQAGHIHFLGKSLSDWSMPRYRSQVLYLHQRPALWEGSVEANLQQVFLLHQHRRRGYQRQRILQYLRLLNRDETFLDRPSSMLSGGERQITAFLRGLQLDPMILLLDEPTASLDPESTASLETLVQNWQADNPQRAYLWVSHDAEQRQRMTQRAFQLRGVANAK